MRGAKKWLFEGEWVFIEVLFFLCGDGRCVCMFDLGQGRDKRYLVV